MNNNLGEKIKIKLMKVQQIIALDGKFRTKGLYDEDDLHDISSLVSDKALGKFFS